MKFSYGLPTHRVDLGDELVSAAAIGDLTAAAEMVGFDAVYTTEHPFPVDGWLAKGGHHTLDPLVALSFAAAAAPRIRLHTHLFIVGYRNPFLAAKGIASLDHLSGGRVILGVGAGYLEGEFDALGTSFADRNERIDEAIMAMKAAWTGTSVVMSGAGFSATGNTMLPPPAQRPHPPIWVGGNSKRAIRRAVDLGDGWSPFIASPRLAAHTQTAALSGAEELAERVAYARTYADSVGRVTPLDISFTPPELGMATNGSLDQLDGDAIVRTCRSLATAGVTWVTVALPGETRQAQAEALDLFGRSVLSTLADQ